MKKFKNIPAEWNMMTILSIWMFMMRIPLVLPSIWNGYDENTEHKAESVANGCLAPDQAGSEHNFSRPC